MERRFDVEAAEREASRAADDKHDRSERVRPAAEFRGRLATYL